MSRLGVLITGPNAVGKTTLGKRLAAELGVPVINFDHEKAAKGASDVEYRVTRLTEIWKGEEPALVIEGVHFLPLAFSRADQRSLIANRPLLNVLMTCAPITMQNHLMERCEKVGKTFKPERWDYNRCSTYIKYLHGLGVKLPAPPRIFHIGDHHVGCDTAFEFVAGRVREALS